MSKHTPGPWQGDSLRSGDIKRGRLYGSDRSPVADVLGVSRGGRGRPSDPRYLPNRNLIAAAPDLLAACRSMLLSSPYADLGEECECGEFEDLKTCPHVEARAAIAKAEGKK